MSIWRFTGRLPLLVHLSHLALPLINDGFVADGHIWLQ